MNYAIDSSSTDTFEEPIQPFMDTTIQKSMRARYVQQEQQIQQEQYQGAALLAGPREK